MSKSSRHLKISKERIFFSRMLRFLSPIKYEKEKKTHENI